MKADITKYAAVIIDKQKRILVAKNRGKDYWQNVGGRVKADESPEQCLKRELAEEISVSEISDLEYYLETPATPALGDPGKTVKIIWYRVTIKNSPAPASETERLHWLSLDDFNSNLLYLSPQIRDFLIPELVADGLIA